MALVTQIGYTDKGQIMKIWELVYWLDGVEVTERVNGVTKMQARSVIVQRYKRQIDFISVEVSEVAA